MPKWTPEMDEQLKSLSASGYTGSQVAYQMRQGLTRNAIIGRIHRLGLNTGRRAPAYFSPEQIEARRIERERRKNDSRRSMRRKYRMENPLPIRIPAREEIQMRCDAIEPKNVSLIDLGPDECRWPYGGHHEPIVFCGHRVSYGSYCLEHFFMSIGSGTSSERAALRVLEAAR